LFLEKKLMPKVVLIVWLSCIVLSLSSCDKDPSEVTRISSRPFDPTIIINPGELKLGLGGPRLVNRSIWWRDGLLYIPKKALSGERLPLLVWLHGGGGKAKSFTYMYPIAEEYGVVFLALDARHNTWDGIDSPFGPDVLFIDQALNFTFNRVKIDDNKIALGGISDGASYALALGRSNGDFFTHLIAVAPWRLSPPSPPIGSPRILVAHGTRDNVYSVYGSRYYIVPALKSDGYEVDYYEFDGPHRVPEAVARHIFSWLKQ
jgi:phospholipase/carboxylesterase